MHRFRRLSTACVIGLALLLSGCQRVSYQTRLKPSGLRYEKLLPYFAIGLIGEHEVDLDAVCPGGVHAWRTEAPLAGLLDFVTLGVYTPRRLVVECGEEPR
jgi:hypothetical protein